MIYLALDAHIQAWWMNTFEIIVSYDYGESGWWNLVVSSSWVMNMKERVERSNGGYGKFESYR